MKPTRTLLQGAKTGPDSPVRGPEQQRGCAAHTVGSVRQCMEFPRTTGIDVAVRLCANGQPIIKELAIVGVELQLMKVWFDLYCDHLLSVYNTSNSIVHTRKF
jgi:hypothetical protein